MPCCPLLLQYRSDSQSRNQCPPSSPSHPPSTSPTCPYICSPQSSTFHSPSPRFPSPHPLSSASPLALEASSTRCHRSHLALAPVLAAHPPPPPSGCSATPLLTAAAQPRRTGS